MDKHGADAGQSVGANTASEGWPERTSLWGGSLAIIVLLALITAEVAARNLFGHSFGFIDEVSGYLMVAAFFLNLAACQVNGAFHRIEIVRSRLPARLRCLTGLLLDLVSLGFCGILLWYLARFERLTFERGELSNSLLATPLWIPRAVMPIGIAILLYAMVKTILAAIKELRRP